MGNLAARVGDPHICPMFDGPKPHVGGPVLPPGNPNVWIGGRPAATVGNFCACTSLPDTIAKGSLGVFINKKPAARMLDPTVHGGRIILGCFTVNIGDFGDSDTDNNNFLQNILDILSNTIIDLLEEKLGMIVGFVEGIWDSIKDLAELARNLLSFLNDFLTNPVETTKLVADKIIKITKTLTAKETWDTLTDEKTWQAIGDLIVEESEKYNNLSPYEKGKVQGNVLSLIFNPLDKINKLGKVSKALDSISDISKVGRKLEDTSSLSIKLLRSKKTTERIGDFGERIVKEDLQAKGFDRFFEVQNASGNGVDIIAKNSKTGEIIAAEVKSTQQARYWDNGQMKNIPLSNDQKLGGESFTYDRLYKAINGEDGYTDTHTQREASEAFEAIQQAKAEGKLRFEKHDVYIDADGNQLGSLSRKW